MAGTKKAAQAGLASLDLTRPKNDNDGKLHVQTSSLDALASAYRDAAAEIAVLVEEQKERKRQLVDAVGKRRLAEEKAGRFYKSCTVETDAEEELRITWADQFSALDTTHEGILRRAFGKAYDDLFEPKLAVKLESSSATLDDIKEALGSKYDALCGFLSLSTVLKMRSGFMERRARMRRTLDEATNEALDTVIGQTQAEPRVIVIAPKEE